MQAQAESLIPRLARNMAAVPTEVMLKMIQALELTRIVTHFSPDFGDPDMDSSAWKKWILPNEDVSHLLAEKYLLSTGCSVRFEDIHARNDMIAVKASQPIIPECEVSRLDLDIFRIKEAQILSQKSPDWWRQIGVMAFRGSELLACGWNEHFPTEYETYIFGDPRLNFDAQDPSGMDAYVSLHAEEYMGSICAELGIPLRGASVYINTFPCGRCARFLRNTKIKELFFREGSSFLKGFEVFQSAGIRIVQVRSDPESA